MNRINGQADDSRTLRKKTAVCKISREDRKPKITPEMAEAGAQVIRAHFWDRELELTGPLVAQKVFQAMLAVQGGAGGESRGR